MAERLARPRRERSLLARWGWLGLALSMALVVPWLLGGENVVDVLVEFPIDMLGLMLVMTMTCWNLNALRLRLLLDGRAGRLGQGEALAIEMAAKFALCATPGGSGGAVTLLALLARRGFSPSRGSAIFLVDQGCDMLFFLAILGVLASISLGGNVVWPHQGLLAIAMLGLVGLMLLVGLSILRLPRLLRQRPSLWLRRLSPRRRRWLARRLIGCRRALIATLCLPPTRLAAILGLCAAHWLLRYSLLYLAVLGVGGQVEWAWTFLTQMLAMAASQVSILPGGAGAAELGVGALLMPLMPATQAAAAVVVWRLVTYHLYLLAGAPAFALLMGRWLRHSTSPSR
ncbi:lysylphosphatidylglycerol synthase transmembrane domain-containing protein [Halomonas sp. I1]|uniref:lysylphosphatidylglycerol synthase transmembrane domain-containing protein n=1 Tax=Halomonas sp. I1 TaxID=393536 RepID=UPI0028E058EA|nr:lysylphosphatidylglycerol synthase transmembrane domain-containing protein [Halomonas sp. I1]MDT8894147.1 lysylphosphatidylglycerol synthase transmembrane domain-containing protein [Halomonas sp. I1]